MGSIWKSSEETRLLELCHAHLSSKGFRVVDMDFRSSGRSLVRIFIEKMARGSSGDFSGGEQSKPESEQGLGASIGDCAEVSRILGDVLESEKGIPGAYDLEVSSPGIDRRLRLAGDFEAVVGQSVRVQLRAAIPGRGSKITGTLMKVYPDRITLDVEGSELEIPLESVKLAQRIWQPGN